MSALTISKVIESEEAVSKDTVITKIEEALKKEFDKVKIKNGKDGEPELYCRVKTKLLNPIVSIKGPMKVQTKDNKAKLMIDADTKTNGWFWFTFVVGLFFWPLWLLMFFMYYSQKKSSIQAFEKVFERMEFDLSGF
tara:strand:+ start:1157 stop:1567 length:411 start_codon:yes stop_codon:yes gene_type:complete